jgi:hypothetical protein
MMNVELLVNQDDPTGCLYLRLSEDVLRYPEELPLLLRNIVVLLSREFLQGDCWELEEERFKRFEECLKVIAGLERAFPSLVD